MSYKFYKSTTLKSVALNNDTNIIFDIANQNKTNVFLNTLLLDFLQYSEFFQQ